MLCSIVRFVSSCSLVVSLSTCMSPTPGLQVDIVKNGSNVVEPDTSGQLFLNGTSIPLPPLPPSVDEVAITLQAFETMVSCGCGELLESWKVFV